MVSELVMVHFTAASCYVDSTKLPGLSNPFLLQLRRNVLAYGSGSRMKFMFRASSSLKDRSKAELQKGGFDDSHDTKYENGELPVSKKGTNNEDEQVTSTSEEQAPDSISSNAALKGSMLAGVLLLGTIGGLAGVGFTYREQLNGLLLQFSDFLEGYGPAGYVIFVAVYAGLEVLAIPAIPLTMSAGLLFGTITGTIIVSISGTVAATVAFLIARYVARDRLLKLAEGNKKFMAIDKAIGENGFRIVTLLRLSPLLPFSLGNYLYGLTSVKLVPYVFGSWLGMLPGTWAYVSAGAFGRALIEDSELAFPKDPEQLLVVGTGLLATIIAATYVTQLAKDAMQEIE